MKLTNVLRVCMVCMVSIIVMSLCSNAGEMTIVYNGELVDGSGNPIDTAGKSEKVIFRLYDELGAQVWEEQQRMVFNKGLFSATLGNRSSLDDLLVNDERYFLEVRVVRKPEVFQRQQINAPRHAQGILNDARAEKRFNNDSEVSCWLPGTIAR